MHSAATDQSEGTLRLGLLVRPGANGRSGREALDIALAAAASGWDLSLCFLGAAALELVRERDCGPAGLPVAQRGWASLPGLATVRAFVEPETLSALAVAGVDLQLPVTAAGPARMRQQLAGCHTLLVLGHAQ